MLIEMSLLNDATLVSGVGDEEDEAARTEINRGDVVSMSPVFLVPNGHSGVLSFTVYTDDGLALEEFTLVVSGSTGKIRKIAGNQVKSAADQKSKPKPK